MKSRFLLPLFAVVLTAGVAFGVKAFASNAFNGPLSAPPNDNAYAPLDTSNNPNTKVGGLMVNTGGASVGFVVASGNTGIGTSSPLGTLDIEGPSASSPGTICLNTKCISAWPGGALGSNATLSAVRTYTSNATWTKPANLVYAIVEEWGGGGGGGSGSTWYGGGGGGGGAYVETFLKNSDLPASSYPVTVGLGGDFAKGGDTSFDGIVAGGGYAGSTMVFGAGGTQTSSSFSPAGTTIFAANGSDGLPSHESVLVCQYANTGTHGSNYYYQAGGTGGSSPRGGGGGSPGVVTTIDDMGHPYIPASGAVTTAWGGNGGIGVTPGGGGGGGAQDTTNSPSNCSYTAYPGRGEPGGNGQVVIYEYTSQ